MTRDRGGPDGRLIVRPATDRDRGVWDEYVLGHPWGSPYHLFAWKEAIERAYAFTCTYLLAEDDSGIRGVLPLARVCLPGGKGALVSLPYCDFGGIASDDPAVSQELLHSVPEWTASRGHPPLEVRSPAPLPGWEEDTFRLGTKARLVLELPEGAQSLLAGFRSKLRSQLRKPQRDGLTSEIGGVELLDEFYGVLRRNMRDLGSPVHSREWFRCLLEGYGTRMRLCVVRMPDGSPAAGGVMFCTRRSVTVPWASSLRELNRWNPNMLLYWTMLSHAADGGWEWFDFGRSPFRAGTWRFKRQWGAEPAPLYWGRFRVGNGELSPLPLNESTYGGGYRDLAERVIRKLPVPVATFLGSRLRKYISL